VFHQKRHLLAQDLRFHFFVILSVVKLRLRLQKRSSLALNQNLPLLVEHRDFGGMNAASFGPGSAFSLFCNPQRSITTPPVTKTFKPYLSKIPILFIGKPKASTSRASLNCG
jgi:hypothetical protein